MKRGAGLHELDPIFFLCLYVMIKIRIRNTHPVSLASNMCLRCIRAEVGVDAILLKGTGYKTYGVDLRLFTRNGPRSCSSKPTRKF